MYVCVCAYKTYAKRYPQRQIMLEMIIYNGQRTEKSKKCNYLHAGPDGPTLG